MTLSGCDVNNEKSGSDVKKEKSVCDFNIKKSDCDVILCLRGEKQSK